MLKLLGGDFPLSAPLNLYYYIMQGTKYLLSVEVKLIFELLLAGGFEVPLLCSIQRGGFGTDLILSSQNTLRGET